LNWFLRLQLLLHTLHGVVVVHILLSWLICLCWLDPLHELSLGQVIFCLARSSLRNFDLIAVLEVGVSTLLLKPMVTHQLLYLVLVLVLSVLNHKFLAAEHLVTDLALELLVMDLLKVVETKLGFKLLQHRVLLWVLNGLGSLLDQLLSKLSIGELKLNSLRGGAFRRCNSLVHIRFQG